MTQQELKPCPFCNGEGVIYEYSTVETCPCSMQPAQPAEAEGVEAVEFWVLFDATTPEPYIKKMMPEGVLAFFDHEEDAIRAKSFHPGTDYKRVPYVRQSDHLAALSAVTAERGALKHALDVKEEFYQDALHSHIVLARQVNQLRAELEALRKKWARVESERDRLLAEVGALRAMAQRANILLRQIADSGYDDDSIDALTCWLEEHPGAMATKGDDNAN